MDAPEPEGLFASGRNRKPFQLDQRGRKWDVSRIARPEVHSRKRTGARDTRGIFRVVASAASRGASTYWRRYVDRACLLSHRHCIDERFSRHLGSWIRWEPTLLWNHYTHPVREDVKRKHF